MIKQIILIVLALLLVTIPILAATEDNLSIYQALAIAEDVGIGNFTSLEKITDYWVVKGVNLQNLQPCELLLNAKTGLIQSALNITPKEIILGDNTYEYSGTVYPTSDKFYKSGQVWNGFEIYMNDARYFKIKQGIFIRNENNFIAYFMTKGPDVTK